MKRVLGWFVLFSLVLAACGQPAQAPAAAPTATPVPQEAMAEEMDIVDTAVAAGSFETLVAAVQAAGLVDTLKSEGPFTVFAPTDEAFAALPAGTVESLLQDPEGALTDILLYHVVAGKVMAADAAGLDGQMVETVGGNSFMVTVDGDSVMVDEAKVIQTDIETSNGVIHVIDAVIIPASDEEAAAEGEMAEQMDIVDTAVAAGSFETLVAAVQAAGLVDTLKGEGPFTVFAPTDAAFAALPAGTVESLLQDPEGALTDILLYHVVGGKVMAADAAGLDGQMVETVGGNSFMVTVDGDSVMVDEAKVIQTDIETANGVIHVIDAVIIPASDEEAAAEGEMAEQMDIVDTAVAAGSFETLVAAVQAAGLVDTLKGEGPFTVFAPTDEAFAALPAGTVESLLEDPEGDLTAILLYHVVGGKVMAADAAGLDGQMVETAGGSSFTVTVDGETVMVDEAKVIQADIETSNGVIHVIDAVIIPASE